MRTDPYRYTVVFVDSGERWKTYAYTREEARRVARRTLNRNGWHLASLRDMETDFPIEYYHRVRNQETGRTRIVTRKAGA